MVLVNCWVKGIPLFSERIKVTSAVCQIGHLTNLLHTFSLFSNARECVRDGACLSQVHMASWSTTHIYKNLPSYFFVWISKPPSHVGHTMTWSWFLCFFRLGDNTNDFGTRRAVNTIRIEEVRVDDDRWHSLKLFQVREVERMIGNTWRCKWHVRCSFVIGEFPQRANHNPRFQWKKFGTERAL